MIAFALEHPWHAALLMVTFLCFAAGEMIRIYVLTRPIPLPPTPPPPGRESPPP